MNKSLALLFAVLCLTQIASSTEAEAMSVDDKRIEELLQTTTGRFALAFAELNNLSGGPYDALIEGIQYIVDDLESQKASQQEAFGQRIKDHQSEVVAQNDIISASNIDISQSSNLLANALYPQREQNQRLIDNNNQSIAETRDYMEKITTEREQQNAAYNDRVTEQNGALAAVDQAVEIMEKISRGDVSFAQNANLIRSALQVASKKSDKMDIVDSEFI